MCTHCIQMCNEQKRYGDYGENMTRWNKRIFNYCIIKCPNIFKRKNNQKKCHLVWVEFLSCHWHSIQLFDHWLVLSFVCSYVCYLCLLHYWVFVKVCNRDTYKHSKCAAPKIYYVREEIDKTRKKHSALHGDHVFIAQN